MPAEAAVGIPSGDSGVSRSSDTWSAGGATPWDRTAQLNFANLQSQCCMFAKPRLDEI